MYGDEVLNSSTKKNAEDNRMIKSKHKQHNEWI